MAGYDDKVEIAKNQWIDVLEEKLDRVLEEIQNNLESVIESSETQAKTIGALIDKTAELSIKVVNLANKLEEHLKERDAHNPGVMRGR